MKYFVYMIPFFVFGCSSKVSSISSVQPMQPNASLEQSDQCGWIQVNETVSEMFSSVTRQYDKQLYYCCPGSKESPKPMCYQTQWVVPK